MSTIKALLGNPPTSTSSITSNPSPQSHTPPVPRLLSPVPLTSAPSSPDPTHARPASGTPIPPPTHLVQGPALRPKPKIIKDAPVFTPSSPRGPVRFPPHVSNSTTITSGTDTSPPSEPLSAYHAHFSLYPPAPEIALYPRHIPYNSEKRVFVNATARDFFEVFQYTFRVPGGGSRGDDGHAEGSRDVGKAYAMLWDYNTGLVRTTPLFKCCGYGKVCCSSRSRSREVEVCS